MNWKDFELPSADDIKSVVSIQILSGILANITNFFIHVSSSEPKAKEKLDIIKMKINMLEKKMDIMFQKDLAASIETMPDIHKKNINLQTGWIRNTYEEKYDEYENTLYKYKEKLLEAQSIYDEIYRKIQTGRVVLDVGRSILSSLKEELKNLDNI